MKVSYQWLQTYFSEPLPLPHDMEELLSLRAFEIEGIEKVSDDWVIDVDVLPNRSSDCLSHRGIAREISALIQQPMKYDPLRESLPIWKAPDMLAVEVKEPDLCPRYMGAVVRGVKVGPSPEWLKKVLETLGQRSINNIVDATNYVMLNLGQPLHAFDLDKLAKANETARIQVRRAQDGEKITVLSGETYELTTENLLIADGVSGVPLAIAGIKGGKAAEIDAHTKNIVLEAANFNYVSVRKTSRKLKLVTDASVRFQNEPSPELVAYAMRDVVELITKIAGGMFEGVVDVYQKPFTPHHVSVTLDEINAVLGAAITQKEIDDIFARLGFEVEKAGQTYTVTSPFERTDLNIKEDLIEEVGRVYGYENIKAVLPPAPKDKPVINKHFYYAQKVRQVLASLRFSEVYTYTLRDKGEVELENPLAKDKAFMRVRLTDGIKQSLELNAHNAPLLGLDVVKIFEIGTVFTKEGEHASLALGVKNVRVKKPKAEEILKQARIALEDALGASLVGAAADDIIEIDFDAAITSLAIPDTYDAYEHAPLARYTPFSSYPFVLRDIALWVPERTQEQHILDLIKEQGGDLLVRTDLFDTFAKEGRVSYAFHLVFQSKEKTLTDGEVGDIMDRMVASMQKEKWEVR